MKAHDAQKKKREKEHVHCEKLLNDEECRGIQLLRELRVQFLFLRMREERMPMPGKQLPVRLPQVREQPVTSKRLACSMGGRGAFDANTF